MPEMQGPLVHKQRYRVSDGYTFGSQIKFSSKQKKKSEEKILGARRGTYFWVGHQEPVASV